MDLTHPSTLLVPVGIAALVCWRMYSRIKRLVGRQRLSKVRPWLTVSLFSLLLAVVLLSSLARPLGAFALVAGVGVGVALGFYCLSLTKFEQTSLGLFYTPNAHLGVALSLLLVARIGYRAAQLYFTARAATAAVPSSFARSPLTLLILGTLAGYYVTYALGLLRWRHRASLGCQSPASGKHGV